MERIELLRARIALYHRYLREGAEGDMARAYLWLIRCDEIELAAIAKRHKNEPQADTDKPVLAAPWARTKKPKDD